jgi:hypothetical protein
MNNEEEKINHEMWQDLVWAGNVDTEKMFKKWNVKFHSFDNFNNAVFRLEKYFDKDCFDLKYGLDCCNDYMKSLIKQGMISNI